MACVIIPTSGWPLREDITDGWKKGEGNAEEKEYAEFKQKVQQPKTGNLVRFTELEMGERSGSGSDLDVINL